MRLRTFLLTLMCALALPASAAQAQETPGRPLRILARPSSGWLGFGYSGGLARTPVVVDTVIPESPAAKAGLQKSDTITAVNGLRASQQLLSNLGLQPGDEVELTIRRAGGERTLALTAAERPEGMGPAWGWGVAVDPDRILEDLRIRLDSLELPEVHVQTLPDSSGRMMLIRRRGERVDTIRLDFNADSVRRGVFIIGDSVRVLGDSAWGHTFRIFNDSLRSAMDSVFIRLGRPGMHFRFFSDSVIVIDGDSIRIPDFGALPEGRAFAFPSITRVGFNSVAGMQLEEVSEQLGKYFGASHGLLVLNVAEETPAARAGLQEGDVILEANDEEVRTIPDLRRILARSEDHVRLQILRERQELTRTLELDRRRDRQ